MTPLAGWENFYVIVGSSAGALIGLQFVVMALVADMPRTPAQAQAGHAFATPTIVHFGAVLMLSAALSAPWHSIGGAAVLWGLMGLGWSCVCHHRGSAPASTNRIPARVRGLAVSCCAAFRGVRNPRCIGVRGSRPSDRGHVRGRNSGAPAALHRHSQRLGRRYLPRLCQEAAT